MHQNYRDSYNNNSNYNRFAGNLRQQPDVFSGYRRGEEVNSGINAYDEEDEEIRGQQRGFLPAPPFREVVEKDVYSPYVGGMDVRLAHFVNQHNINMDDGAVIYPIPNEDKAKHTKK